MSSGGAVLAGMVGEQPGASRPGTDHHAASPGLAGIACLPEAERTWLSPRIVDDPARRLRPRLRDQPQLRRILISERQFNRRRFRSHHPRFADLTPDALHAADVKLNDAQWVIAREYGFPSWRLLKAHIEQVSGPGRDGAAHRLDVERRRHTHGICRLSVEAHLPKERRRSA